MRVLNSLNFIFIILKLQMAYTKVLQGSVDYASLVFPYDASNTLIDIQARASLWKSGLDYGHGTMHGIGFYLGVHESLGTPTYLPGNWFYKY